MLRLMLLRHGKAAWPQGTLDMDRPLAKRGREASVLMGKYLKDQELVPDLVLVSPARRTLETWEIVAPILGDLDVRHEPRIYEAPVARLLTVLHEIDRKSGKLLMIGHNPGFEDLAGLLVSDGDADGMSRIGHKFPTAGLAVIDFPEASWKDVKRRSGRLERFMTPKSLGNGEDD
jgi:phosphohistidine phosphatase